MGYCVTPMSRMDIQKTKCTLLHLDMITPARPVCKCTARQSPLVYHLTGNPTAYEHQVHEATVYQKQTFFSVNDASCDTTTQDVAVENVSRPYSLLCFGYIILRLFIPSSTSPLPSLSNYISHTRTFPLRFPSLSFKLSPSPPSR